MPKHIELAITLLAIFIAFFLGYLYKHREYEIKYNDLKSKIHYIDISNSTRSITIKNSPENIKFRFNGELMSSGSVELK